jgi:hypothetical protein
MWLLDEPLVGLDAEVPALLNVPGFKSFAKFVAHYNCCLALHCGCCSCLMCICRKLWLETWHYMKSKDTSLFMHVIINVKPWGVGWLGGGNIGGADCLASAPRRHCASGYSCPNQSFWCPGPEIAPQVICPSVCPCLYVWPCSSTFDQALWCERFTEAFFHAIWTSVLLKDPVFSDGCSWCYICKTL